jgi:hypothetical protein
MYNRVLELRRRIFGEEHPDTLQSIRDLSTCHWNQGRRDEAIAMDVGVLEVLCGIDSRGQTGSEWERYLPLANTILSQAKTIVRAQRACHLLYEDTPKTNEKLESVLPFLRRYGSRDSIPPTTKNLGCQLPSFYCLVETGEVYYITGQVVTEGKVMVRSISVHASAGAPINPLD